jgi:hypothetical protein
MAKQSYIIKTEAAYKDTWLAPWAGYQLDIVSKGKKKIITLCGMTDSDDHNYFTKCRIKRLLTPLN